MCDAGRERRVKGGQSLGFIGRGGRPVVAGAPLSRWGCADGGGFQQGETAAAPIRLEVGEEPRVAARWGQGGSRAGCTGKWARAISSSTGMWDQAGSGCGRSKEEERGRAGRASYGCKLKERREKRKKKTYSNFLILQICSNSNEV